MAPLAKTTLVDRGSCESLNDDVSGPYSILFLDDDLNRTTTRHAVRLKQLRDTQVITPTQEHETSDNHSDTIVVETNKDTFIHQTITKLTQHVNNTITKVPKANNNITDTTDISSLERNETHIVETNPNYTAKQLNATITKSTSHNNTVTNSIEDITATSDRENNCQYVSINNKTCENILNETSTEAKRRKTSVIDNDSLKSVSHLENRRSLLLHLSKLTSSTPSRSDFTDNILRRLRFSSIPDFPDQKNKTVDDSQSKRNSLERDETSLGILTPDQIECLTFPSTRSPSLEYELNINDISKSEAPSPRDDSLGLLDEKCMGGKSFKDDIPSQLINLMDYTVDEPTRKIMSTKKPKENTFNVCMEAHSATNSLAEPSLGILDEQMINLSTHADFTSMKLLLDNKSRDILTRLDETPSPAELPFDPTPIVESDPKIESNKVKTVSSFVTSITSITSLDTGYQGDGEMSRPASRGAENSPLTRRPVPRPQTRRPDPMTDSDFYTESDADVQEENPLRGDRKAQVIDGTLYGVDPQAAADIYVNNRENMDSSGIFTDLENNLRAEEDSNHIEVPDVSPSESTKTISANSQNNIQEVLDRTVEKKPIEKDQQKENPKKRIATSPATSSPTTRYGSKTLESSQKFKIPKRDVASKVKTLIENVPMPKVIKKPVNKWDAVMNKISKNEQPKTNLKDVKSKVFSEIQLSAMPKGRPNDSNRNSPRPIASPKMQNNKL